MRRTKPSPRWIRSLVVQVSGSLRAPMGPSVCRPGSMPKMWESQLEGCYVQGVGTCSLAPDKLSNAPIYNLCGQLNHSG